MPDDIRRVSRLGHTKDSRKVDSRKHFFADSNSENVGKFILLRSASDPKLSYSTIQATSTCSRGYAVSGMIY